MISFPSRLLGVIYDSVVAPTTVGLMRPFDRKAAYEIMRHHLEATQSDSENPSSEPSFGVNDDKWIWEFKSGQKVDLLTGSIYRRNKDKVVRVKIEWAPAASVFERTSPFYLCCACGNVEWDDRKIKTDRYIRPLSDILELDPMDDREKEMDAVAYG